MSNVLFQGGTRLYEQDQAALQQMAAQTALTQQRTRNEAADAELNPLKANLLRAQIGHQGASTEHQGTLAELNRVQASTILRKADKEDRVAAAIAQAMGGGKKQSAFPQFDEDGNPMPQAEAEQTGIVDLADVGNRVMAAGDLEKGEKLVKLAADLKKSEAATRASAASELVRKTNAQVKKLEFMRQVFSGVTDPASHARAMLLLQGNELTSGEEVPKGLQTYNPAMISQFLAGSKVQLDKKRVEIASYSAASADQARKAAQTTREFLAGLAERRTRAVVERAANIAKTGDEKSVPLPNSAEVRLMRESLAEDGIEFDEDDHEALVELAEQAKILTTRNPSISRKEAITRVAGEAQKRGDLVAGGSKEVLGIPIPGTKGKAKLKQTEGSLAMPAPLPATRAELVIGNYYRGPNGQIEKWNGTSGEPISKQVKKAGG
jgi:hypothetical protein